MCAEVTTNSSQGCFVDANARPGATRGVSKQSQYLWGGKGYLLLADPAKVAGRSAYLSRRVLHD